MSKQPESRYGSARELARHLQALQARLGLPVTDLVGQDPAPAPRPDLGVPLPQSASTGFPSTGHHLPPTPAPGHQPTGGLVPPAPTMPPAGSASRTGRMILIGGAVAAVVVAGTALAVHLSMRPSTTTTTTPATTPTAGQQEPIGKEQVAALAPARSR
ncbi:hypothetical protein ACFQ0B_30805 [Nonomuraea thailandensis]